MSGNMKKTLQLYIIDMLKEIHHNVIRISLIRID
jgi:hypothetical protein